MIDQLRDLLFKIIYKLLPFLPKLALSNYRVQKLKPEKLTTIHWKKLQRSLRGIWISPIIIVLIAPYLVIIIIPSTAWWYQITQPNFVSILCLRDPIVVTLDGRWSPTYRALLYMNSKIIYQDLSWVMLIFLNLIILCILVDWCLG